MIYENKNVKKIYRVLPHLTDEDDFPRDSKGEIDSSFDDYYIPCNRVNSEIYTTDTIENKKEIFVAYVPSKTVRNDIAKKLSEYIIKEVNNDGDAICGVRPKGSSYETEFYFYDCDLEKFAKLLRAKTNGAKSIKPTSDKNVPSLVIKYEKYDKMPVGWFDEFKKQYSVPIQKSEGIKATLVWDVLYKDFGKTVKVNLVKKAKEDNYRTSHYIHKNGMWKKFEKYLTKRMEDGLK